MKTTWTLRAFFLLLFAPLVCNANSLTTLFDSQNPSVGVVYLDLQVGTTPIVITGFDTNTASFGAFGWTVYLTAPDGTAEGNEATAANFPTVAATGTGTGKGLNVPSPVVLDNTFVLDANTRYGMALVTGPEALHAYTVVAGSTAYGSSANQLFSNADLALLLGASSSAPFTGPIFNPRVWNGTIKYDLGSVVLTSSPNVAIVDGAYIGVDDGNDGFGTDAGMVCDTIDASGAVGPTVTRVAIDLGITHTWIGDLTVKLQSPDGTILALMERVAGISTSNNTGDNGATSPFGDSSNLDGTLLNFADDNPADAETMGGTLDGGQRVCTDDGICAYQPNPDQALVVNSSVANFAAFNGENAAGSWTLCVGDGSTVAAGILQTWSLLTGGAGCTSMVVSDSVFDVDRTIQACGNLTVGPNVTLKSPGVFGFFAGERVSFVGDFDAAANMSAGTCGQNLCTTGPALNAACMPCVVDICAANPGCCTTSWDASCIASVGTVCGLECP